jgi:DNA (cytosine-5)-methyltransferase 3A
MNVLSLFDGMSCGQIALNRIGIKPEVYYAAEVDKYAIKVTQANYPDTVQLGDVTQWREWDIDWSTIDLLIGGSPCQGFSFAGKQLAFDDPRSKLFFVYVDILNHIKSVNQNVKFMLENVKMKKEFLAVISEQLGVEPVFINSALLSAQNRQRYYWCNWNVEQPDDRGIVLADILETDGTGFIKSHGEYKERSEKSQCIDANYHKGADNHGQRTLIANPAAIVGRKLDENGKRNDSLPVKQTQCLEVHDHGKSRCLSTVQKDTVVSPLPPGRYPIKTVTFNERIKGVTQDERGIRYNKGDKAKSGISELGRILKPSAEYSDALTTSHMPKLALNSDVTNLHYRKLTPIECERLQGVEDDYTNHVSNTQRYKMLGNGWQVDTIVHIFSQMQVPISLLSRQLDLFGEAA